MRAGRIARRARARGAGLRAAGALALACGVAASLAACGKHHKKKHGEGHKDGDKEVHAHDLGKLPVDPWAKPPTADCEKLPFAASIPLAEASGAVLLPGPAPSDGPELLVVGDSGTNGAYVEVAADDGHLLRSGNLPLGEGAGDDLEGLALDGTRVWGLTSGGWMRAWEREGTAWKLVEGPYTIEKHGPCKHDGVNCGHDFEGVCLRPDGQPDDDGCIGYAAARAEGHLYCLARDGARIVALVREGFQSPHAGPKITRRRFLADCAIGADGVVWTGDNLLGSAMVRRLAAPEWKGALGDGFPEAMALAPGGIIYRFSDTATPPGLAGKWHCPAAEIAPGAPVSTTPPLATAREERDEREDGAP